MMLHTSRKHLDGFFGIVELAVAHAQMKKDVGIVRVGLEKIGQHIFGCGNLSVFHQHQGKIDFFHFIFPWLSEHFVIHAPNATLKGGAGQKLPLEIPG